MAVLSDAASRLAGPRIAVVGTSGSGKSTFARQLALATGATHVELDRLHWRPGWQPAPPAEFEAAVRDALGSERWICDGNYAAVRSLVLSRATDLVWLRLPLRVVLGRLLRRTLGRVVRREEVHGGNRETLRQTFLSRDSILLWALRSHADYERVYAALPGPDAPDLRVHVLRGDREADAFLREIEGHGATTPTEGSLPSGRSPRGPKQPS